MVGRRDFLSRMLRKIGDKPTTEVTNRRRKNDRRAFIDDASGRGIHNWNHYKGICLDTKTRSYHMRIIVETKAIDIEASLSQLFECTMSLSCTSCPFFEFLALETLSQRKD